MKPILYYNPLSPYSNKCAIALAEKGIAFEARLPLSFGTGNDDPAHLAINPLGEVPSLIDGDTQLFESAVIFDYIDTSWPAPRLMPEDPGARAKALLIQSVMDTRYDPINWGLTELLLIRGVGGEDAVRVRNMAEQRASKLNSWLETQLGEADWFGGNAFAAADIFVAVHLNGAGNNGLVSAESPLGHWLQRVRQQPTVASTFAQGTAFMASLKPEDVMRWQRIPRLYRDSRVEWVTKTMGAAFLDRGLDEGWLQLSRDVA
jgi:glutathione S-transferase